MPSLTKRAKEVFTPIQPLRVLIS